MSIRKMIGLHPASREHHNHALADAVHAALGLRA